MITHITIENFRCIKHFEGTLASNISIIAGENNLGKSTILNAINWVITDSLYGDLEDLISSKDMTSLKPITATKGDKVKVSLVIEKHGITKEFTRTYYAKYKSGTDEISTHTNDYFVEGERRSKAIDFFEELYEWLDYKPIIKSNKIREVNLFTDPNYALNKLDVQQLRQLIVECGCSISDDEVLALTDNLWVRENAFKCQGKTLLEKLFEMKKTLKRKSLEAESDLKIAESKFQDFKDAPDTFENFALNDINARIEELIKQKTKMLEKNDSLVSEFKVKQLERINALYKQKADFKTYYDKRQKEIEDSDKMANSSLYESYQNINTILSSYRIDLATSEEKLKTLSRLQESDRRTKQYQASNLTAAKEYKFVNVSRCPMCDYQLNQEEQERFENDNAKKVASLEKDVNALVNAINERDKEMTDINSKITELKNLIGITKEKLDTFQAKIDRAHLDKQSLYLDLEKELKAFEFKINTEITKIQEEEFIVEAQDFTEIDRQKQVLEELRAKQYELKSRVENKQAYALEVNKKTDYFNDTEYNYNSVREMLKLIIKKINDKATELFGIEFVMLEENISNDGYTETCYAKVDSVPFEHLNTSQKIIRGIQFIDRLKQVMSAKFNVAINQLPILIDKLECLANIEDLHALNFSQIICTKVTNDKEITIKGE